MHKESTPQAHCVSTFGWKGLRPYGGNIKLPKTVFDFNNPGSTVRKYDQF